MKLREQWKGKRWECKMNNSLFVTTETLTVFDAWLWTRSIVQIAADSIAFLERSFLMLVKCTIFAFAFCFVTCFMSSSLAVIRAPSASCYSATARVASKAFSIKRSRGVTNLRMMRDEENFEDSSFFYLEKETNSGLIVSSDSYYGLTKSQRHIYF